MRTAVALLAALVFVLAPTARATHDFTENYDEAACCDLADADEINREIVLFGVPGLFSRDLLASFYDEPLLPVSNGGDRELLWDNEGHGDAATLALTPDDEAGNYPLLGVHIETAFAVHGDLAVAEPRAGVVVRHTGPEEIAARKFYAAYAKVFQSEGALVVEFRLEKWFGDGLDAFVSLDSGPLVSDRFPVADGENFRIELDVSAPDADHVSSLEASFSRLAVIGGVLTSTELASLAGSDRALAFGQVGVYARGGSVGTEIAFDDNVVLVSGAKIAVRQETWGGLKEIYR